MTLEIPLRKGSPGDLAFADVYARGSVESFSMMIDDAPRAFLRFQAVGCLVLIVGVQDEGDRNRYDLIDVFG